MDYNREEGLRVTRNLQAKYSSENYNYPRVVVFRKDIR